LYFITIFYLDIAIIKKPFTFVLLLYRGSLKAVLRPIGPFKDNLFHSGLFMPKARSIDLAFVF
jgi:hypothetical protein